MTLDEALAKLAEGDRSAFGEVYNQTRKTVYYIALSVVRERMLAEDVMQNERGGVDRAHRPQRGDRPLAQTFARTLRR